MAAKIGASRGTSLASLSARLLAGLVGIGITTLVVSCQQTQSTPQAEKSDTAPPLAAPAASEQGSSVVRGKFLVLVGGCSDCHTPMKMGANGPEPDMSKFLSGHPAELKMPPAPKLPDGPWVWIGSGTNTAFAGPWGVTYAANLTPDQHTGMGVWTQEMFIKAMHTGKHMSEGRAIMPPMPWQTLSQLGDDDLKAMYEFLRTVAPIKNQVPEYAPPEQ